MRIPQNSQIFACRGQASDNEIIKMIVNEITTNIIRNAREGESIRSLANRIGFAYSAVYGWILELEKYGVVRIIRKGNKNIIKINKENLVYEKIKELDAAVSVIDKDKEFWRIIQNVKLRLRFARGTAIAIWTKGGFITGDFYNKIYFLEVHEKDASSLKELLDKKNIAWTEDKIVNKRPLVYIIHKKNKINVENINKLPVMPLKELVSYCKELYLDNVLEQLDILYGLKLNAKYSEIHTNI
jgi:DNA-binding transcriptional ArsR family regulator